MNVYIKTEAAQFLFWQYINEIFVAVHVCIRLRQKRMRKTMLFFAFVYIGSTNIGKASTYQHRDKKCQENREKNVAFIDVPAEGRMGGDEGAISNAK